MMLCTVAGNLPPYVSVPLVEPPAVSLGDPISILIPFGSIVDPDPGTVLQYDIRVVAPGASTVIPLAQLTWLAFDPDTRLLTGVAQQRGRFLVRVNASDPTGAWADDQVPLVVNSPPVLVRASALPHCRSQIYCLASTICS